MPFAIHKNSKVSLLKQDKMKTAMEFKTHTAPDTMSKIFGTVEVFQAILLELELRDLLLVRKVHSHFKKVIDESPALQQRLFFRAAPSNRKREPELNPLLVAIFPSLFMLGRPVGAANTLLVTPIRNLEVMKDPHRREVMLRPDASWRRMLPVQPPAMLGAIKLYSYDSCVYSLQADQVHGELSPEYQPLQESGLRMGLLFSLIASIEAVHPCPVFFVRWKMFPLEEGGHTGHGSYHLQAHMRWDYHHYDALFRNPEATENSIELYHNHDSLCGLESDSRLDPLEVDSPFMSGDEDTYKIMIDFVDEPNNYATDWLLYGRYDSRTR